MLLNNTFIALYSLLQFIFKIKIHFFDIDNFEIICLVPESLVLCV